jgi:zinc-ribbon domain
MCAKWRRSYNSAVFCFACGKQLPDDAAFCLSCGKAIPKAAAKSPEPLPSVPAVEREKRGFPLWFLFSAVGVVLAIALAQAVIGPKPKPQPAHEPYMPDIILTPMSDAIVSGAVTVPAGQHLDFRFDVDPSTMRDAHVVGHFLYTGGLRNDIEVVLAEEKEFGKWIDGQVANVFARHTAG